MYSVSSLEILSSLEKEQLEERLDSRLNDMFAVFLLNFRKSMDWNNEPTQELS